MSRCWRRASPPSPSSTICTTRRTARPTPRRAELAERIAAAAATAGIGLTLLPVFYAHATFGGAPPRPEQRRFVTDLDGFARLARGLPRGSRRWSASRRIRCAPSTPAGTGGGRRARRRRADPHARRRAGQGGRGLPGWSGARPVRWLLDHAASRRALVRHPRHAHGRRRGARLWRPAARSSGSARSPRPISATASSTRPISQPAGAFGVGSDSNVEIGVAAELKQLEYAQRLARAPAQRARAAAAARQGARCSRRAAAGGAQALAARRRAASPKARSPISSRSTRFAAARRPARTTRSSTPGFSRRRAGGGLRLERRRPQSQRRPACRARRGRRALRRGDRANAARNDERFVARCTSASAPRSRRRILSGEWPPGHRIPFEHELTARYGCSRMTVSKALGELVEAGLIERRRSRIWPDAGGIISAIW